ncbi:peroxygenase 3 [Apiospora hydei]|uniref:Peroxygenase 3 n=1 Tax=Apiospora hydei TaxID=1337664 RepID=A0ABR1WNU0_9PEZI
MHAAAAKPLLKRPQVKTSSLRQHEARRRPTTRVHVPLQRHIAFWDQDRDGIIRPLDVYSGFRALGFSILFSLDSLLIPLFFSYPTRLAHSLVPDWRLRIYVASIHKAKHGSDTGVYDVDGQLREHMFDDMFARYDEHGTGGLSAGELWRMIGRNRCAADVAGWAFSFMEWWTTWLLLQQDGRVWREDLKACYDGTLFWRIADGRKRRDETEPAWQKGYGFEDFVSGMWNGRTWKSWELKGQQSPGSADEDAGMGDNDQKTLLLN